MCEKLGLMTVIVKSQSFLIVRKLYVICSADNIWFLILLLEQRAKSLEI